MEDKVIIYTDGSASPNPGPGGWGAILMWGNAQKELCGSERQTTNNRMELTAAVKALQALKRPCVVELHTDSEYLVNGMTQWIFNWVKRDWQTSTKKPVENKDLWQALYAEEQKHKDVDWIWVKGHASNPFNNRCDELANEARRKRL